MLTANYRKKLVLSSFGILVGCVLSLTLDTRVEARTVLYLETDLMENEKAVSLEVALYKPAGAGPYPLLVFHHGSTGKGTDQKRIRETYWSKDVARFFNARGWMVAFPQRRGRGGSDGLYDEGFKNDRSQGYSCQPERSLKGADRALADAEAAMNGLVKLPDVDASRIIIGGVSRGGALSIAYAGLHPDQVKGVINFVGGWMTNKCHGGPTINRAVFLQGAPFPRPTLWLYGQKDPAYSTAHARWNYEMFVLEGGHGQYRTFSVPDKDGHRLHRHPAVWGESVDQYLAMIQSAISFPKRSAPMPTTKITSPYEDVPLPRDLTLTKPAERLSAHKKQFSGLWTGASDNGWHHVLAVEGLDKQGGQAVFALGINQKLGIKKGHWARLEAVWKGQKLTVLLDGHRQAIYRLEGENSMELSFLNAKGVQIYHAWLTRFTAQDQ